MYGVQGFAGRMFRIIQAGKRGLDLLHMELGAILCKALLVDIEREEISGPDHAPSEPGVYKWAYQGGSVYCGDKDTNPSSPAQRS
jgi:hypothetical protein